MRFTKPLIAFLLIALSTSGVEYFVDYVGGSDSNNGTSTNTPWKRFPGASGATGVPGGMASLPAGTTITFKAGVTNIGTAALRGSGTISDPIIYRVATNWGTGTRAHFTSNFTGGTSGFTSGTTTSTTRSDNWFIGLSFKWYGGWPYDDPVFSGPVNSITPTIGATKSGSGGFIGSPALRFRLQDCDFAELGHWTNVVQNYSGTSIKGGGWRFDRGAIDCTLDGCTFRDSEFGLFFSIREGQPARGNIVTNCHFSGTYRWALTFSLASNNAQVHSNLIVNTTFNGKPEYDSSFWKGSVGNDEDHPHTNDGAHFNNSTTGSDWGEGTGVTYRGCHFYTDTSPFGNGGTAHLFFSRNACGTVENCVISGGKQPIFVTATHTMLPTPFKSITTLRYNTIYGGRTFVRMTGYSDITDPTATLSSTNKHLHIYNNIFIKPAQGRVLLLEHYTNMLKTFDGNVYYNQTLTESEWTQLAQIGGANLTFSGVKARGWEGAGKFGNPQIIPTLAIPWVGKEFLVNSNSVAINAGLNRTNLVPFDYLDVSRVGKAHTPGAFVYNPAGAPDPGDTNAPTPNPLTWVTTPQVGGNGISISMQWATATDDGGGPVIYDVTEHTGNPGCAGISTIATSYTNSDIGYDTECIYSVTARDEIGNVGGATPQEGATTVVLPPPISLRAVQMEASDLVIGSAQPPRLFYFDAESLTTPDGFTNTGTISWADQFAPYQGVASLYVENTNVASHSSVKWMGVTNLTIVGSVRRTTIGETPRVMSWYGEDGTSTYGFTLQSTGADFWHGTVTNTIPFTGAVSTWYRFRLALQIGSGANGLAHLTVHTNEFFSASTWTNSIASGTGTGSINQGFWGNPLNEAIGPLRYDYWWARPGYISIGDDAKP